MAKSANIDSETWAFALVGRFLHDWAIVESQIDLAIQSILELEPLQGVIIVSNLNLQSKIHIIKTMVDLVTFISEVPVTDYKNSLEKIRNFAIGNRNMIAHCRFGASSDGEHVVFISPKTKGKLRFLKTKWTQEDFDKKFDDMDSFRQTVFDITQSLKKPNLLKKLTNQLQELSDSKSNNIPPEISILLGLPLQVDHMSDMNLSNYQKDK